MAHPPVSINRPSTGWEFPDFREVWAYRELLYSFVWRDLKVRYKQAVLGAAWSVFQPFATMVVFTLVFGKLIRVPSPDVPYAVFAYSGLVMWTYFANVLTKISTGLVDYQSVVTKIYFPRLIIPLSSMLVGLVDLGISSIILVVMLIVFGIVPTAAILALPLVVLIAMATSLGIGIWLSALNVEYRDVKHILPFLIQLWLFATPVAYPLSLVPQRLRAVYSLNPMVGVVEGFRWAVLGHGSAPQPTILISLVVVAAMLVGGLLYFRHVEDRIADVV